MGLLFFSFWFAPKCESVVDCIQTGLLIYSFWFVPKCESLLETVSTWVYCYSLFGLLPCVRVYCGLHPHRLTDLLFLVCSHACVRVRCGLHPHRFTDLHFLVCSQVWESVVDCMHMSLLFYSIWFALMCELSVSVMQAGVTCASFSNYTAWKWLLEKKNHDLVPELAAYALTQSFSYASHQCGMVTYIHRQGRRDAFSRRPLPPCLCI